MIWRQVATTPRGGRASAPPCHREPSTPVASGYGPARRLADPKAPDEGHDTTQRPDPPPGGPADQVRLPAGLRRTPQRPPGRRRIRPATNADRRGDPGVRPLDCGIGLDPVVGPAV